MVSIPKEYTARTLGEMPCQKYPKIVHKKAHWHDNKKHIISLYESKQYNSWELHW
jgi:hypothetical protein